MEDYFVLLNFPLIYFNQYFIDPMMQFQIFLPVIVYIFGI